MIAPPPTRYVEHTMGMPISLALRGRHAADALGHAAWQAVLADLRDVDRVFSTYRPDSEISRLDRGELTLADCRAEVAEVLALGEQARLASAGAFDVRPQGRLDPSGVVKGWAVDRASAHLSRLPDTDFCLSAGGDLICLTRWEGDPPWRIGIEDPHDPTRLVAVVPVRRGAVATSGSTHRGPHVVDPCTGTAPVHLASVTVVGARLTSADIDATTAFVLDHDGPGWLRAHGRSGLVVRADRTVEVLAGACSAGSGDVRLAGRT